MVRLENYKRVVRVVTLAMSRRQQAVTAGEEIGRREVENVTWENTRRTRLGEGETMEDEAKPI